jgi:acyl carrier protein
MSLNLGPMKDVGVVAENTKLEQYLLRKGYILVQMSELFELLDYSMSGEAKRDNCKRIITGFNKASMTDSDNNAIMRDPIFGHIPSPVTSKAGKVSSTRNQSVAAMISEARDAETLHHIVAQAIAGKIATITAFDPNSIDLSATLNNIGLDSLVTIELKNWVMDNFKCVLHTSEILTSSSISALARIVTDRMPQV